MYNTSLFANARLKLPGNIVSDDEFKTRATNCGLLTVTITALLVIAINGVVVVREYTFSQVKYILLIHMRYYSNF